uniref:Uncharacterized protein n=1 Tax=Solanum tuberosum TaxID=4113 RepID=M1DWP8_SOLTU
MESKEPLGASPSGTLARLKFQRASPGEKPHWRHKCAVGEIPIDSATTYWIAQSYTTWDAEDQCKKAMEREQTVDRQTTRRGATYTAEWTFRRKHWQL